MIKFEFVEDEPKKQKPELTKMEMRQDLINDFLSRKNELDKFLNEYIDFLQLEELHENEIDRMDLKAIADCIKIGLGGLDEAWNLTFAFDRRIKEENNEESY